MMRARAPRRAEFRPRGRDNQQRRKRAAFRKARNASSVVGSVQCRSSTASTTGCARAPAKYQAEIAANCRRRSSSGASVKRALGRERNVDERREQRNIFHRVELDLRERRFEIGETPFGRRFGAAEPLPPPVGDRMKRRILQELRRAPLDPGVRRIGEAGAEFLDQARLAEARLADDHDELALAPARAVPAPEQHRHLVLAADERRQRPLRRRAGRRRSRARCEERRRLGRAFERMLAAILGDEQAGDLTLNARP